MQPYAMPDWGAKTGSCVAADALRAPYIPAARSALVVVGMQWKSR